MTSLPDDATGTVEEEAGGELVAPEPQPKVVDIGINLTNRAFRSHWKDVIGRAIDAGVETMILTGTSIRTSEECLALAEQWYKEEGTCNLYATVGIHPHDAKTWNNNDENNDDTTNTLNQLRKMIQHPLAVAVGECGLDYNRNYSSKRDQIYAFQQQVQLAYEYNMPLFIHEREAHEDLVRVLDGVSKERLSQLPPPIVVHCFTGEEHEALKYIERGYSIGFTGTICKKERGAPLREKVLPKLPIERIMIETDAPFMGFKKGRKRSEPADCVDVAKQLSETKQIPFQDVCQITTANAYNFFQIKEPKC